METVIMALSRNAWGQTKKSDVFKRGLLNCTHACPIYTNWRQYDSSKKPYDSYQWHNDVFPSRLVNYVLLEAETHIGAKVTLSH